jgi:Sensors of blue-light using FAD
MKQLRAILFVCSATRRLQESEMNRFVLQAQQRNQLDDITGVMLHNDGNFMQYMEGPDQAVASAFGRVCASREQTGVILLCDMPIDQRHFGEWAMAFAQPTNSELLALSTANWTSYCEDLRQRKPQVPELAVLDGFWRQSQYGDLA